MHNETSSALGTFQCMHTGIFKCNFNLSCVVLHMHTCTQHNKRTHIHTTHTLCLAHSSIYAWASSILNSNVSFISLLHSYICTHTHTHTHTHTQSHTHTHALTHPLLPRANILAAQTWSVSGSQIPSIHISFPEGSLEPPPRWVYTCHPVTLPSPRREKKNHWCLPTPSTQPHNIGHMWISLFLCLVFFFHCHYFILYADREVVCWSWEIYQTHLGRCCCLFCSPPNEYRSFRRKWVYFC